MQNKRAATILDRLTRRYPKATTALAWRDAWGLLVATVLAAQCTDARVNQVTPTLFARWPDPASLAAAEVGEIEAVIRSTGFFRNKAKHLKAAAGMVAGRFKGAVPDRMEDLLSLPGVARKTANIILSNAFGKNEGIAVDTHVKRLAFRLGLTESGDPAVIERDLMPLFPCRAWGRVNHVLVWFGREVCAARNPRCPDCELADVCPKRGVAGRG
jgi:endonuclease-3